VLPVLALVAGLCSPAAAQVNEYEMRYGGQVAEVSVDDLLQMPEQYAGRAVRTRGQLEMVPAGTELRYALRGTFGGYLQLIPVQEVGVDWEREARTWVGREVEVTGGVNSSQGAVYLLIWAYLGPPDEKAARRDSPQVSLEDLVTKPGRHDGKVVTVRGQFRGENLFGDLPSASRERSSDWVLKDDVFAVWVSGRKARGAGWRLDPRMRRDTGKWLEVTGRVRVKGPVVTLQATDVTLSKAPSANPQARAEAPPPPPPRPKKPPVVVFSLPLDGEREVPPDATFQVQFSKDMDEPSFKGRVAFRYAGRPQPGDNSLDAMRVTYDGGLRALQVDPGDLLRPGRVVELLLLPGIVDLDGLPLETRPGKNPGAATDTLRYQVAGGGLLSGSSR
jgi:Bacterial Ig-like domain